MNATQTVAEIVARVAAHLKIADVPAISDASSASKAADALAHEAQYSEVVRLAAHAARRIAWGEQYHQEALGFAKAAAAALPPVAGFCAGQTVALDGWDVPLLAEIESFRDEGLVRLVNVRRVSDGRRIALPGGDSIVKSTTSIRAL